MQVISKKDALKFLTPDRMLFKYCSGKYDWTGKAADYLGKEVRDLKGIHTVYVERRTDSNGPYACLMCVCDKLN